ncbi:SDR family oxidoreductase [Candidatus Uhrbacteria bacterium]|nr:SDR family oxidoreductase [Candidatus Uhrbacteria bacterium]
MEFLESAIILGGTSGLGREIAKRLLSMKIRPIIMGRSVLRCQNDSELDGCAFVHVDLTKVNQWAPNVLHGIMRHGPPVTQVYWVAGVVQHKPFHQLLPDEMNELLTTHVSGPMVVLNHIYNELVEAGRPIKLITIASTSTFRFRSAEELYCPAKAFKANWAVQMMGRLQEDLPGSTSTLIMPGGMKTPFWLGEEVDISAFMDPGIIAGIVLSHALVDPEEDQHRVHGFLPIVINRSWLGDPIITYELPALEWPRPL